MHAPDFDLSAFLSSGGGGRKVLHLEPKQALFFQGEPATCVFYINKGRAKLTVVSRQGKEATITLLGAGDFVGEETLALPSKGRVATAVAVSSCTVLQIERAELLRALHRESTFSDFFLAFLLARGMRTQADLVDQLFNSSEKRLARILLLMAKCESSGEAETVIPKISQETLAEMVGTTRSRVSFFMNRFRDQGFIAYDSRITVRRSLLNVVLQDQTFEQNATSAPFLPPPKDASTRYGYGPTVAPRPTPAVRGFAIGKRHLTQNTSPRKTLSEVVNSDQCGTFTLSKVLRSTNGPSIRAQVPTPMQ